MSAERIKRNFEILLNKNNAFLVIIYICICIYIYIYIYIYNKIDDKKALI